MKVEINKKKYTIKIGTRALLSLKGREGEISGDLSDDELFNLVVDLAWAGLRDKGDLNKELLADAIDDDLSLFKDLMNEFTSLKGLEVEAKK